MKVEEVPQDPSHYNGHKRLCYATGRDGKYTRALSCGWETETVVTERALIRLEQVAKAQWDLVLGGRRTPLSAILVSRQWSVGNLAAQVKLPRVLIWLARFPRCATCVPLWVWIKIAHGLGWAEDPLLLQRGCTPDQAERAMAKTFEL